MDLPGKKNLHHFFLFYFFSLYRKKKASFEISVLLKVMLSCSARDKKTQDILRLIRYLVLLLFLFVLITQARLCFRVMAVTYTDVDLNLKCLPQISRLTVSRLHP